MAEHSVVDLGTLGELSAAETLLFPKLTKLEVEHFNMQHQEPDK